MTSSASPAPATAVVLAAGASKRLGQPKQLLPYQGATLLDATLAMVRQCAFNQIVVTLGGAAKEVQQVVDLADCTVVINDSFQTGCSSSIARALTSIDPAAAGFTLLLGDQPQIDPKTVADLLAVGSAENIGVIDYQDGFGHPFWLGRRFFAELANLHGDKGVWKLIDAAGEDLVKVPTTALIPADVDTWADYTRLLDTTPPPNAP